MSSWDPGLYTKVSQPIHLSNIGDTEACVYQYSRFIDQEYSGGGQGGTLLAT